MNRTTRAALAVLGAAGLVLAGFGTAGPSSAASHRTVLAGSKPAWATSAHRVRSTPGGTAVDFKVYLPLRNEAAAQGLAQAVSTRGTAASGKFLTPAQFRSRFAPTSGQVSSVRSWLTSHGFRIADVPGNNRYVEATGTVRKAAAAFRTSFAQYRVQGRTLRSNSSPLSVPSNLGVSAVTGLDESYGLVQTHASPPAGFRNGRPCSRYWGEKKVTTDPTPDGTPLPANPANYAPCGYAGKQLQDVYGMAPAIDAGNDGSGVTVAVIDAYASPTIKDDLAHYFGPQRGVPAFKPGQFREVVAPGTYRRPENPKHDPEGWSGEETLDIEAVHTMAPGANVVYLGSPNNRQDMDAALNKVVNGHLADIITNSYGFSGEALPPGYIKPVNDTLIQAAATGISVFFSSGDNGDETGAVSGAAPTPDWPASSPWVTAVGGTSLGIAQNGSRVFEQGWETGLSSLQKDGTWSDPTYLYGSGGGTSRLFRQPSYQAGVVPPDISNRYPNLPAMRAVPDVSAIGDPNTGMLVGQTQRFADGTYYDEYRIGGTSLSSPIYAGIFALAVQRHGPYGLANPALYAARGTAYDVRKINPDPPSSASNPETDGDVRVDYVNRQDAGAGYRYSARWFDVDSWLTIHVRNGYDDVTGVGSPNGSSWLQSVVAYP